MLEWSTHSEKEMGKSTIDVASETFRIRLVAACSMTSERLVDRLTVIGKLPAFMRVRTSRYRNNVLDQWIAGRIGKVSANDQEGEMV